MKNTSENSNRWHPEITPFDGFLCCWVAELTGVFSVCTSWQQITHHILIHHKTKLLTWSLSYKNLQIGLFCIQPVVGIFKNCTSHLKFKFYPHFYPSRKILLNNIYSLYQKKLLNKIKSFGCLYIIFEFSWQLLNLCIFCNSN